MCGRGASAAVQSLMSAHTGYSSLGQINTPKMSDPVRESGSSGDGGGEPAGMEHTLQCLGEEGWCGLPGVSSVWVERCWERREWPQCSGGDGVSPVKCGLLNC